MGRLSLAVFVLATSPAFAHGDPPQSCENRYDGTIESFVIEYDGKEYDPMLEPGIVVRVPYGESYSVTFMLAAAETSSTGSTEKGTLWFRSTAAGMGWGQCVPNVHADRAREITVEDISPSTSHRGQRQYVSWGSLPEIEQVHYVIHWE